jgi:transcriptional regulator with XRE-family HTH domain
VISHSQSSAFCDVASLLLRPVSAHRTCMTAKIGHNARKPTYRHFLREWRLEKHLSGKQLAARMGDFLDEPKFSHTQISRIENGKTRLSEDRIYAAAEAFNIEPAWLFVSPEAALRRQKIYSHFENKTADEIDGVVQALAILSKAS